MEKIIFFDTETDVEGNRLLDIGAVKDDQSELHTTSRSRFVEFIGDCRFLCGHNILAHDLNYLKDDILSAGKERIFIDTLPLSPLLFPCRPYHHLVKDDKLQTEDLNNPVSDSRKAQELFHDEVDAFCSLPPELQGIYVSLLENCREFSGFFTYLNARKDPDPVSRIRELFRGKICVNADLESMFRTRPAELAYCLALVYTDERYSIIPSWVSHQYPDTDFILSKLRNVPCTEGCEYCSTKLNIRNKLKQFFGFDSFRTYNGEPLQEKAAEAASEGQSLLAIFPTGGGKSLTFQLPALMAGESVRGLTVVISPLQSLMKDQVDNLEKRGITEAVTVNGLLNPLERADAIRRVSDGLASLLYISPESLRSASIENLLLSRNVVRFVIDEAHCFSAWGQDFRVDYLYIGEFIRELQKKKRLSSPIPVSCFTATAKQKVISDIREYFRRTLDLELNLYSTEAERVNLRYEVRFRATEEEKYQTLRSLIQAKHCPTIVYVSRTRKTRELAERLTRDGYYALPFNGKMDSSEKIENQNAFMQGGEEGTDIIVATSAFGMGVDKDNVGLVIHYEISDSLESYVQEAGRAGRDQSIHADCYVLFNEGDLDKHFSLLSQSKLSISEINQVWKAVRELSKQRGRFTRTPLEIARAAGWDDQIADIETRVKTAVAALENAGFVRRGRNVPHIYATGILAHSMSEAAEIIDQSDSLDETQKTHAKRIMTYLISKKSRAKAKTDDAESRVDYIGDRLGLPSETVVDLVNRLRDENLLADTQDMSAHIDATDKPHRSAAILEKAAVVEDFLIDYLPEQGSLFYKEVNDAAVRSGVISSTVKEIRTVILYWTVSGYAERFLTGDSRRIGFRRTLDSSALRAEFVKRIDISRFIIEYLFSKTADSPGRSEVPFSVIELRDAYQARSTLYSDRYSASDGDIKDALLYLNRISALELDGGFLVFYNAIQVQRLKTDNHVRYKKEDYRQLDQFYAQRIQQIHIVGEYANLMAKSYEDAQTFVKDYFQMDYMLFRRKYFRGGRSGEINRNITPQKYNRLFGELSAAQREIIEDDASRYIVVAAGPGSGKTKVLVHKLASLLLLEDVKSEQLLMLTFSRSAATEFKSRLIQLIDTPACRVEIKTFHSYCFELLGRIGNLEDSGSVVRKATDRIRRGEVDISAITKTVLVIDEAQDMDEDEFALIEALMVRNENMRVIAVGDDDQNIYEFRGSDSGHMKSLVTRHEAAQYELLDNYRSGKAIVDLANAFISTADNRMKQHPIQAVSRDPGTVTITRYRTDHLETATLETVRNTYRGGSCCVVTHTNEEALRMAGLLKKNGYAACLIQSNDGFNLYNLYEIRTFIRILEDNGQTGVISQAEWENAVDCFQKRFQESACFEECMELFSAFDRTTPEKYLTDFSEFVRESKFEDFTAGSSDTILVSTIHKTKGREFDSVYIMLNHYSASSDQEKRALYVAITRAKKALYINYNNYLFDRYRIPGCLKMQNNGSYPECGEILLQLMHDGVFLGYFRDKFKRVSSLHSGALLTMDREYLESDFGRYNAKVVKLSKKAFECVLKLQEKGYEVTKAFVRYLVYWKPKDEPEESETLILLPDICFNRSQSIEDEDTGL